ILFSEENFITTVQLNVSFPRQVVKLKYFNMELPNVLEDVQIRLVEKILEVETLVEGAKKQISVNAYERNPIARQKCLDYYGYNCSVCDFNF
ncbi:hypothetical protein P4S80_16600, partial [Aeribacillus composti]|nr:hypothetical protein [Aeribacillus composti]